MFCVVFPHADTPEPGGLAILSVSNGSSLATIQHNAGGDDVGEVSDTTEHFPGGSMPNLEQEQEVVSIGGQDQVAVSIGGQELEVVSIGNQLQDEEVLASPVEEEQLPLGVGQRNEVPDGTDGDAELGLPKPVQATT